MLKDELSNLVYSESETSNNKTNEKVFKGYFKNPDYTKLEQKNTHTVKELYDILNKIHETLKHKPDIGAKFERTAEEIISSGSCNGCCDYTTVFEKYARDYDIPTVHLLTADVNWIKDINTNKETKGYRGHHFCECYISNKWVLVDPTNLEVYEDYDKDNFYIDKNERNDYYVYAKCHTIDELIPSMKEIIPTQTSMVKYHNQLMKKLFTNFDLNKLSKENKDIIEI